MLYLMHWKVKDGKHDEAVKKFLSTGAPFPEGCKLIDRFHAPGSVKGWLVAETEDANTIYEHASEWAELLIWDTTPVFKDKEAGETSSKIWKD
jgi:hypothetical protein